MKKEYELELKSVGKPTPWFDAKDRMWFTTKLRYALKGRTLLLSPFTLTIKSTNETGDFPKNKLPKIRVTLTSPPKKVQKKRKGLIRGKI